VTWPVRIGIALLVLAAIAALLGAVMVLNDMSQLSIHMDWPGRVVVSTARWSISAASVRSG